MLDTLKKLVDNAYFYSVYSDDFAGATRTHKCPRCRERIRWMRLRLVDRNGKSSNLFFEQMFARSDMYNFKGYIPGYNVYRLFSGERKAEFVESHRGAMVECYHCRGRWPLLKDSAGPAPAAGGGPAASNEPIVSRFVELDLEEEPQGAEHRVIDNANSPVSVTRQIVVRHEWSRRYDIGFENTLRAGSEVSGGTELLASWKLRIENEFRLRYAIASEQTESFQEEISVQVPPRTRIRLTIRWKQLWQKGEVRIESPRGEVARVPYRVAKGITFDQVIEE